MKAWGKGTLLCVGLLVTLSACNLPQGTTPEVSPRLVGVLLVSLVVAGVLALAGLLFVLLRSSRADRVKDASPVSRIPDATSANALPEQTLLGQGRYRVLSVYAAADTLDEPDNVYAVRGTTPLSRCPYCDTPIVGEDVQSCAHCGGDLSGITLIYPKFLARETGDARVFESSVQLAALRLHHPALIVPEDVFTETTLDPPRYYRVEPIFRRAQDLPSPQPAEKVLRWGIALAQGMAYLHQRHVALQKIDIEHIVISDGIARHVCIDNVLILPHADRAQADVHFAENVRTLADTLLALLEPLPTGTPPDSVPASEGVVALLERAQQTGQTASVFAAVLEGALRGLYAPENVKVQVGVLTDVGRARLLNEDSVLTLDLTARFATLGLPVGLYVVADGMGGHAAGDVASQLTIRTIQEAVNTLHLEADGRLPDAAEWLEQLVTAANQAVYTQRRAADSDMGCTLVLALMFGGHATIANLGDSRAYWLMTDGAVQITTDHSLVERLVAAGHITPQEARQHPQRNVIYRVVGDKPKADYDLFEQALAPGEALLLCSDGLSGMVADARIWSLWRAASSSQAACEQLVEAANQAGGVDNISVVIVQAGSTTE